MGLNVRVYLDSCIVIYLHEGPLELRTRIRGRLESLLGDRGRPCVSDLSRLECRVAPLRARDEALLALYDAFFALTDLDRVDLHRRVFDRATALRAEHGLRTPDALHVAAALEHGCAELWTNDERLARKALPIRVLSLSEPDSGAGR